MSGSFNEIDVPPTLVSFAVDIAKEKDVITPELKKAGDVLWHVSLPRDAFDLPDVEKIMQTYDAVHELMVQGLVKASYVSDTKGLAAAAAKMAFGNGLGVSFEKNLKQELFDCTLADLILEIDAADGEKAGKILEQAGVSCRKFATVNDRGLFEIAGESVSMEEALKVWKKTLDKVFPYTATKEKDKVESPLYQAKDVVICSHKIAQPRVFIPVFPGTNCEYDSAAAFERAGASTEIQVFCNQSPQEIRDSVEVFKKAIDRAQIIMFPGGFSAGDEPDGSAKFFATAFRNEHIKEAVTKLLQERDGLVLGICNGFQALIKLGLVPGGAITGQDENSPTLTFNTVNRHISKMVSLKVVSNKSPWLQKATLGGVYINPASHGEGRFVANDAWLDKLFANGQVATQYCAPDGSVSMDEEYNINGSYRAIEGITSEDGRVFGKMAHSERRGRSVAINIVGEQDMKIFESGVEYFK